MKAWACWQFFIPSFFYWAHCHYNRMGCQWNPLIAKLLRSCAMPKASLSFATHVDLLLNFLTRKCHMQWEYTIHHIDSIECRTWTTQLNTKLALSQLSTRTLKLVEWYFLCYFLEKCWASKSHEKWPTSGSSLINSHLYDKPNYYTTI